MSYLIRMTPPQGPAEYIPLGFGYGVHCHTTDPNAAERFTDPNAAHNRLRNYRYPPAFWESERRHAAAMENQYRAWRFEVVHADSVQIGD